MSAAAKALLVVASNATRALLSPHRVRLAIAASALMLVSQSAALRAQTQNDSSSRTGIDSLATRPRFQFSGASWLMGLRGTVRPSKDAQTATLEDDANRVWEFGESSAYATMVYRRHRFVMLGDLSGFQSTDAARLESGEAAVVVQRLNALTVTPGYAWIDRVRGSFSLFGGVRIWRMSNSVGVPALEVEDRARTSYYDVVFASRVERALGRALTASLYADAGGFQIASDLTWQATGTLMLRPSETWSLIAGYRHLSVDYRGDNKRVSLAMFGPTFGASIAF